MMVQVETKDVDIKMRIGQIVADRGMSRTKLAEQMNLSPAYLASVINSPDKSVSATLLKAFATIDINTNWLLTGVGRMDRGLPYKEQAEQAEAKIKTLERDMDRASALVKSLQDQVKDQIIVNYELTRKERDEKN